MNEMNISVRYFISSQMSGVLCGGSSGPKESQLDRKSSSLVSVMLPMFVIQFTDKP